MSIKFSQFCSDQFMSSLQEVIKFKGFSESERLSNKKFYKKHEEQAKNFNERYQEIQKDESLSEEQKKEKVEELWVCVSDLEPSLDYEIVKKAPLSEIDMFFLCPVLVNLPEEYK